MKKYLGEFLMDGRVLKIHKLLRLLLVYLIIVPFRSKKNLKNYGKIWMREGSPLMVYGERLCEGVRKFFGDRYMVELAMRYQNPSIESKVQKLLKEGTEKIIAVPLYPQYASATTGSVLEELFRCLQTKWHIPSVDILPPFYGEDLYLDAVAEVSLKALPRKYNHYLFSYHGLPIRHLQIGETGAKHCKAKGKCCDKITEINSYCYRAHCMETTRCLIKKMKLDPAKVTTSFQSRFGNDPWIKPFTTETIKNLATKKGCKKIAVFCPAFVADCIETLEEIDIGEREIFLSAGGTDFKTVPCLNDSPVWIQNLSKLLQLRFGL